MQCIHNSTVKVFLTDKQCAAQTYFHITSSTMVTVYLQIAEPFSVVFSTSLNV
jgi:hypothetical protein